MVGKQLAVVRMSPAVISAFWGKFLAEYAKHVFADDLITIQYPLTVDPERQTLEDELVGYIRSTPHHVLVAYGPILARFSEQQDSTLPPLLRILGAEQEA